MIRHWGADIGGTTIIVGYLQGETFVTVSVLPTDPQEDPKDLLGRIASTVLEKDQAPASLGLGVAGFVDRSRGCLVTSPNLPSMVDAPLGRDLERLLGCPVTMDNDCNAFAAGAVAGGEIPRQGLWLLATLGTGIGGAIVMDGTVVHGTGFAGEFGHMTLVADGTPCPCGSSGCWERYASAEALLGYCRQAGAPKNISEPLDAALMADAGDPATLEGFSVFGRWVGIGLSNLSWCFSPEGIVLAGGLANAWRHFGKAAEAEHRTRCPFPWNVTVLRSCSETGAAGAALLGRETT